MNPGSHTWRRPAALLALLAALLVPLLVPIPVALQQHPLVSPLADRIHVVLFGALVLVLHHRGPLRGRPLAAMTAGLVLGGASELLQIAAGRSASLWDWFQDAQGVALAGCWLWWRRTPARWRPALAAAVVLASVWWPLRDLPTLVRESRAAERSFPVLCDFERPRSDVLWHGHQDARVRRAPREDGGHVLQIDHGGDARWPGAASRRLPWDWSGQDSLLVDARLVPPSPDTLRVSVWIEDRVSGHDIDYAFRTFPVTHAWTTLRVPLADLRTEQRGRPLHLETILGISVYMNRRGHEGPLSLRIDDLRLRDDG